MIRLEIRSGVQTLEKICNTCRRHISDLHSDDIMIKHSNNDVTFYDSSGSAVTRTDIPDDLKVCQCEDCND